MKDTVDYIPNYYLYHTKVIIDDKDSLYTKLLTANTIVIIDDKGSIYTKLQAVQYKSHYKQSRQNIYQITSCTIQKSF
jgi:hypothetical protein